MGSKASAFGEFFLALADAIGDHARNGDSAIEQVFEVGDDVHYQGSKTADHGHWVVQEVDEATNTVTLGRYGERRKLQVNQRSVRHTAPVAKPTARFIPGDVVQYSGSIRADHGIWVVDYTLPGSGRVKLHKRGSTRTLTCFPESLRLAPNEASARRVS